MTCKLLKTKAFDFFTCLILSLVGFLYFEKISMFLLKSMEIGYLNLIHIQDPNYIKEITPAFKDISKNKNFADYKSNEEISIIYVGGTPRMAFAYRHDSFLLKEQATILIVFDDGTLKKYIKTDFERFFLSLPVYHHILELGDNNSQVKIGKNYFFTKRNNETKEQILKRIHHFELFKQKINEIMYENGYKEDLIL